MSVRRVYAVFGKSPDDDGNLIRLCGRHSMAVDFKHKCLEYAKKRPSLQEMVPACLKDEAYDLAMGRYRLAHARWEKRHPARPYINAREFEILPLNLFE